MRVVVAIALLPGCFYVDPIVDRPRLSMTFPTTAVRGQCVTLLPKDGDPAPENPTYDWQVQACAVTPTSNGAVHCNETLVFESHEKMPMFTVPLTSDDVADPQTTLARCPALSALPAGNGPAPALTVALQIRLDARDERGVLISSDGSIAVSGAPPQVDLRTSARSYTVGAPIDVIAAIGDLDTPLDRVDPVWSVSPGLSAGDAFDPLAVPQTRADRRADGMQLTVHEPGMWTVTLVATDPADPVVVQPADASSGGPATDPSPQTSQAVAIQIDPDRAPYLAQWQPIVPPDGTRVPITEPTLFQIPLVSDDLEPYPGIADGPPFGTTQFAWSILPPGATERQMLAGATGNRFDFDPAAFAPGDQIELRVEIRDSAHPWPACGDAEPTCSSDGSDRLQRQTWRLEVP